MKIGQKIAAIFLACGMFSAAASGAAYADEAAPAPDKIITVGEYFNEMSVEERNDIRIEVMDEETKKMLDNRKIAEVGCIVRKVATKEDGTPGEGMLFFFAVMEQARRNGNLDYDVKRLMRGAMIALFKQCQREGFVTPPNSAPAPQ